MPDSWRQFPDRTVYIMVHADDFAIGHSMIRQDHAALRRGLRMRCQALARLNIPLVFTDLGSDQPELPEYLSELELPIQQIRNPGTGNLDQQIMVLKQYLHTLKRRDHLIFSGGWRDACLRRTVNQVASRKPRLIVSEKGLPGAETATFEYPGHPDRPISVAVDWQHVF